MRNTKETNIKNRTYYFFNNMINVGHFNPDLLKIDKKLYRNVGIHYIGYVTIKNSDYVKINCVNLLYLIIGEVDGSIEEKNASE